MLIAYVNEDGARLAHQLAGPSGAVPRGGTVRRITRCGLAVVEMEEGYCHPGFGCHVCVPTKAHPLAAVWAECRRADRNANAATGADS